MSKIEYQILNSERLPEALDCLCQVFIEQEPLTSCLGVKANEFRPYTEELLQHSLPFRLSWMALDRKTNQLVGVRVLTDYQNDYLAKESFGPQMNRVIRFLRRVNDSSQALDRVNAKVTVHSHMVAVNPSYQGKGIAKELLKWSSLWAYDLGYRWCLGEVTNKFNQQILSQIPSYRPLQSFRYKEYCVEGEYPLRDLSSHEECVLFQFRLDDFCKESA